MKDATGRWSYWSDPVEFTTGSFDPSSFASQIVVTEIMYHSPDPTAAERAVAATLNPPQTWDDDSFDYVELRNVSGTAVDLTGFHFTQGFDFVFPDGTILVPGANILIVQNVNAFNTRYGAGKPIAGAWNASDRLSNGGEVLTLQYGLSTPAVFSFAYDDDPALNWPAAADGGGASLVKIDPEDTSRDPALGFNWRSSTTPGGTPGGDDRQAFAAWLSATGESGPLDDNEHDAFVNLLEYALEAILTSSIPAPFSPRRDAAIHVRREHRKLSDAYLPPCQRSRRPHTARGILQRPCHLADSGSAGVFRGQW
jgi:hypothetical protein